MTTPGKERIRQWRERQRAKGLPTQHYVSSRDPEPNDICLKFIVPATVTGYKPKYPVKIRPAFEEKEVHGAPIWIMKDGKPVYGAN
jgi:hypothetical protein